MNKDVILSNIRDNYFYGIDFENGTIGNIKRFDNEKQDILRAYNEAERLDTYALIKSLYIEFFIFESNLNDVKTDEDINLLYNDFRSRLGMVLAIFTNDLMKKIGRSIDVRRASKIFEVFDSVGDALIYIYKLCKDEFIEVSKESNYIDEKKLKKKILHEYLKLVEDNFEPRSTEYDNAFKQYKILLSIINDSSLEEFADIFKRAYYELQKDIENKKGNVK